MADVFPGAKPAQLVEWGYPKGTLRPVPPAAKAFSVIHITGNSRLPSAEGEVAWRLNDPANQNSATFFVNRDGSIVQALTDPLRMAPWANGDVNRITSVKRDACSGCITLQVFTPVFPHPASTEACLLPFLRMVTPPTTVSFGDLRTLFRRKGEARSSHPLLSALGFSGLSD